VHACLADVDARLRRPSGLPRNKSGVAPQDDARHAEVRRKAPRSMMDEAAMHAHALTPFAAVGVNRGFRERPPHAA
jgi:hypothetical protein